MARNSKQRKVPPAAIAQSASVTGGAVELKNLIRQAKQERLEECFRKADSIVKSLRRQKNNAAAMGAEMVAQALRLIDNKSQAALGDPRAVQ